MSTNLSVNGAITNVTITNGVLDVTTGAPDHKLVFLGTRSNISVSLDAKICINVAGTYSHMATLMDKRTDVQLTSTGQVINPIALYKYFKYSNISNFDSKIDYLIHYKLDGTDTALTRVGGDDFRIAPACPEAIGSWFDGSTQYLVSTDYTKFNIIRTGAFSISYRTNFNASLLLANARTLQVGSAEVGGGGLRLLENSTGKIALRIEGANYTSDSATYGDGNWHFVSFVSEGANQPYTIYIDGVADGTGTMPDYDITGNTDLYLGQDISLSGVYKNGGLDDIRVYKRVLTQAEITALNVRCDWIPSLASPSLWLDAQDSTTITESAGAVSLWEDKSGNGNDASQLTIGNQPTIEVIDNKTAVSAMYSSTQYMNTPLSYGGDLSIFCIGGNNRESLGALQADTVISNTSGSNPGVSLQFYNGFASVTQRQYRSTGNLRVNGTGYTSGQFTMGYRETNIFSAIGNQNIGTSFFRLFANSVLVQYGSNYICEILMMPRLSDTIEIQKIEGFLAWKWGLVANLPSDHPYKLNPPKRA